MADASDGPAGDRGVEEFDRPLLVRTAGAAREAAVAKTTGPRSRLYAAQRSPRERWALAVAATAVGLALATVHWGGLLAGGALVGLCWPTLRRALVAGFGFGAAAVGAFAARLALAGSLGDALATGALFGVAVAVPLLAGPLGAAVRGLLPDAP